MGWQTNEEGTAKEYRALVVQRYKVSRRLLELHELASKADDWAKTGKGQEAYAWNRLVGAGFALWRAIPLMLESGPVALELERNPALQVDDGRKLLRELIRHNRVAYEQERSTSYWMAGFYLNDAEDRIDSVRRSLKGYAHLKMDLKAARRVGRNIRKRRVDPLLGERAKRCKTALKGLGELIALLGKIA